MSASYSSEWEQAGFFQKWTFSVPNAMISKGLKQPLVMDDLMKITSQDRAETQTALLKQKFRDSKSFWFIPRLMMALFFMNPSHSAVIVVFTVLEGLVRIAMPVLLINLLQALQEKRQDEAFLWAAVLGALGFIQGFIHHFLFFFSMRTGWNWKTACTTLIHERLFHLKPDALTNDSSSNSSSSSNIISSNNNSNKSEKGKEKRNTAGAAAGTGTGYLVNLISNDVSRFEEFAIFATFR